MTHASEPRNDHDRDREETGVSNQTGDLDRITNMDTSLDAGLDDLRSDFDLHEPGEIDDPTQDEPPERAGESGSSGDVERESESGRGGRV